MMKLKWKDEYTLINFSIVNFSIATFYFTLITKPFHCQNRHMAVWLITNHGINQTIVEYTFQVTKLVK